MSFAAAPNDEGEANDALPKTFTTGENTVTLTASEDGKTLTISGKGDLTKIGVSYVFVENNPVFLKGADDNYTSVAKDVVYSSENTYATRSAVYTAINDFKANYVEEKTTFTYTFKSSAVNKYFYQKTDWSTGQAVTSYASVTEGQTVDTQGDWVDNQSVSKYFTRTDSEGSYTYTRVSSVNFYESSEDVQKNENKTNVLKNVGSDTFVSTDNGSTYSQVSNGNTYNESATYYTRTWNYTTIDLASLIANAYVKSESDFIKALWAANTYETVKFVNTDSSKPLYVDNDIVKAILYYQTKNDYNTWYVVNGTITTLDLGAATCKNFTTKTFQNTLNAGTNTLKLANLTLPQSEDKTVPSQVIESIRQNNGSPIVKNIVVPDGYTKIGDEAFINVDKAESIKLPNGITTIGKSAFRQTGFTSWDLPTSLVTIEDDAFRDCQNLAHVTFPATLRTIGKGGFAQCAKLDSIKLNEGLEIIGNSAFYLAAKNDNVKVLEIPSSVKYIGPAAFNFRWYADVYYRTAKAPISPYGVSYVSGDVTSAAFGSQLLCGNNGFSPMAGENNSTAGDIATGYANRENYMNGGTYIAVLHFRSDIDNDNTEGKEPNAETFTDITRKYERWLTKKDDGTYYWYSQDKKTVGKETEAPSFNGYGPGIAQQVTPGFEDTELGSQFIWPSQAQFIRSYAVNSNGYKWDGVTEYRPELTADEIKLIKDQENGVAGTDLTTATDDYLKKVAYLGTRQFVLISRDVKGPDPDYPVPVTSGERWWTLVVPCNVTKAEVDKVFGADTHLCLFSKVVRTIDETNGNTLHLYFQNDTYVNHYTRNVNGTWTKGAAVSGDDDVVLYAHTPYMIYPTKRNDDGKEYVLSNYELQEGDVRITVVDSNDGDEQTSIKYEFTGTYRSKITTTNADGTTTSSPVHIPQYTYAFGKKGNSNSQFWFYTGTQGTWVANKCLVERYDEKGEEDFNTFFKGDANNSKVNQISTFGGDEETTAIDRVVYHYGDDSTDAPVYNLNGQMVSANGSTDGLVKGIYIQNGKKFVVK